MTAGAKIAAVAHANCEPVTGYACRLCRIAMGTRNRSTSRVLGGMAEIQASAFKSAIAGSQVAKLAPTLSKESVVVVNLSGRGDKDCQEVARLIAGE